MGKSNFYQKIVETYLDEFGDEAYFNFSFEGSRFSSGSRSYDSNPKIKPSGRKIAELGEIEVFLDLGSSVFGERRFYNDCTLGKDFSQAKFVRISEECKPKIDKNSEEVWVTFEGYENLFNIINAQRLYLKKFSHNHKKGKIINHNKKYW